MKAGLLTITLAVLFSSAAAIAEQAKYDGNELLGQCQQYVKVADKEKIYDQFDAASCGGFVQGVTGTVFFYSELLKNDDKFCVPDSATNGQVVRIVVKYLRDNPKLLNENKVTLVWLALRDAYPCK